jgi:hypothetical protein
MDVQVTEKYCSAEQEIDSAAGLIDSTAGLIDWAAAQLLIDSTAQLLIDSAEGGAQTTPLTRPLLIDPIDQQTHHY